MWRNHRRISCVRLLELWSFLGRCLRFSILCVPALSLFRNATQRLSLRFAKHRYDAAECSLLWRMSKENEMFFVTSDDGRMGKSAWWIFARLSHRWRLWQRGVTQEGLE